MLKDRNFAISTLAMFFLGFVLYSSTVLIPQMLQELMGYPAEKAGLALSPGGATIMLCMPLVGFLVSKIDTRYLITFGCSISASALLVMAGWNLQLDYTHAVLGRVLQSLGLAFLFIPINVTAFAYVPREKTNMGTGIINLARNIGASVGIAAVTTMLQRRGQMHQARLGEHVTLWGRAFNSAAHAIQARLPAAGSNLTHASTQAQGIVYQTVQRQSAMLAFIEIFKFLGILFLLVVPAVLLLKPPKGSSHAPAH